MSRRGWHLGLALVASGCSAVLDLEPGTPVDPAPPSCETGWASRVPIDIVNRNDATLEAYQVAIPLAARGADLRFALDDHTPPLAYALEATQAWVAVPELPPGVTRIYAYYDNPDAPPWTGPSPFVAGLVFNPSFETPGSWTSDLDTTAFGLSTAWASDGHSSLAVDAYRRDAPHPIQDLGVSQFVTFPPGSDYVLRFDVAVLAASYDQGSVNAGVFFVSAGNGLAWTWSLGGEGTNITGEYYGMETVPFGPGNVGVLFGVHLDGGWLPVYAKGFFDNIRVRKHAAVEPEVRVGAEQAACAP